MKGEYPAGAAAKFVLLSAAGVILFFVPAWGGVIPVVRLIDSIKAVLGGYLEWVAFLSSLLLGLGLFGGRVLKVPFFREQFGETGLRPAIWMFGILLAALSFFDAPVPILRDPRIGGEILTLGSTVFITIAAAGSLVIFIIRSGLVEFIAVLMEPVMQPVFRLPGEAAVNILSSFVSSASVGVYFTEQYYKKKRYTTRQACSVVTSFSVVSVGYIGVIASLARIGEMYGILLAVSFVTVLIMGAVMIRIPPLCLLPDTYMDGGSQIRASERLGWRERSRQALEAGVKCAESFCWRDFGKNICQSLGFAQKILGVMIPTVAIVLALVYYTSIFAWLGRPIEPFLALCGVPDAGEAAPSVLIGIVEVSLPAILIGGTEAGVQTRFFAALLSIVQIIFFSEAGNAIMASEIPLGPGKLIGIFLARTAVAIPLVSLVSWLVCGM